MKRIIAMIVLFSLSITYSNSQEKEEIIKRFLDNFPENAIIEYSMESSFTDNSKGVFPSTTKCAEMIVPKDSSLGYYYNYSSDLANTVAIYNGIEHYSYYAKYYGFGNVAMLTREKNPERFEDRPIKIDDMEGFVPAIHTSSARSEIAVGSIVKSFKEVNNSGTYSVSDTLINGIECYLIDFTFKILAINKQNYLPVYFTSFNEYQSYEAYYSDFKFNQTKFEKLFTKQYFPDDFNFAERHNVISTTLQAGTVAPDFEMKTIDGRNLKLSDFKGKPILLYVTEIGCPLCMVALPDINEFTKQYEKMKFLGVYTLDSKEALSKLAESKKLIFDIGYKVEEVKSKYGIQGYPTFFIIDKEGKIVFSNVGYSKEYKATLKQEIENVLK